MISLNEFVGGEKEVGLPSRGRKDPEHKHLSGNHKKFHFLAKGEAVRGKLGHGRPQGRLAPGVSRCRLSLDLPNLPKAGAAAEASDGVGCVMQD